MHSRECELEGNRFRSVGPKRKMVCKESYGFGRANRGFLSLAAMSNSGERCKWLSAG